MFIGHRCPSWRTEVTVIVAWAGLGLKAWTNNTVKRGEMKGYRPSGGRPGARRQAARRTACRARAARAAGSRRRGATAAAPAAARRSATPRTRPPPAACARRTCHFAGKPNIHRTHFYVIHTRKISFHWYILKWNTFSSCRLPNLFGVGSMTFLLPFSSHSSHHRSLLRYFTQSIQFF